MATLALDRLATRWQWALDCADRATSAAHALPRPLEVRHAPHERDVTQALLRSVAAEHPGDPLPWLAPGPVTARLLGLGDVDACLFDLDGVLTDSGILHATAWAHALDELLLDVAASTGRDFAPFDPVGDYRAYLDGRPRLDGVRAFLASRGISLSDDEVRTLAARKGAALERGLRHHGVNALAGARRYLAAAGHAHLARGVVSASTTTLPMLVLAQLDTLVDVRADAEAIAGGMRPRPAPDLLLHACERLEVEPTRTVSLTHTPAGVAAAHAAGMTAIGVGEGGAAALLEGYGADGVVPTLAALLDPRLLP